MKNSFHVRFMKPNERPFEKPRTYEDPWKGDETKPLKNRSLRFTPFHVSFHGGFATSKATWILLRPPRDKILSVYLGLVNSVCTRAIAKAFMMKTKEKKERKGEQTSED